MFDAITSNDANHARHRRRRAQCSQGSGPAREQVGRPSHLRIGARGADGARPVSAPAFQGNGPRLPTISVEGRCRDERLDRFAARRRRVLMRSLLDVNVVIALLDADHSLHERATDWFSAHAHQGWASCPIVENGCVRIMSHPGYPNRLPPKLIVERLREATDDRTHEFWADDISLL